MVETENERKVIFAVPPTLSPQIVAEKPSGTGKATPTKGKRSACVRTKWPTHLIFFAGTKIWESRCMPMASV